MALRLLSWIAPAEARQTLVPANWPKFIGPGWQTLLDNLYRELVRLDPGCIIYEVTAAADGALALRFHTIPNVAQQARTLVADAVAMSRTTCEQCGDRGQLCGGAWLVTLCTHCAPR